MTARAGAHHEPGELIASHAKGEQHGGHAEREDDRLRQGLGQHDPRDRISCHESGPARLTVDPRMIGGRFVLAVLVGSIGRWWHGPEHLVNSFDRWQTAAAGAIAAIGLNNLPASMLLAVNVPTHARALLIGLNLGPNLAVTGSLSAVLWLRVARSHGARPSARTYSLLGLVLVPVSIAAALAALAV